MVPPQINNVFIIRHGERLDHAIKMWRPDPSHGLWDPPLSPAVSYMILGHEQAEKTGQRLVELLEEVGVDLETTSVVIYSSPFQRCIDTSLGIARHVPNSILRLELGLGEWMCERFFDEDLAPASRLIARQQEALARQQAQAFASMATKTKNNNYSDYLGNTTALTTPVVPMLPWVDYGYRPLRTEFDFPERYGDMLRRFDEARMHCLATAQQLPPQKTNKKTTACSSHMILLFVTHAVGVNALLDGFRNQLTRPIETGYCSISRVTRTSHHLPSPIVMFPAASTTTISSALPSPKEEKDTSDLHERDEWTVDLLASDTHLT
ncbi:histidine phosphatase superfamily [Zychaea mexicana]|uniref:histidine phosphatase superfamily n=1 Tax=Zychaea mexicana TaxID=64656 RepID=UPI0022FDBC2B|nr:histidine phosphatase superfamily [Zychaea mexicana]KAI9493519.1 histidine phosphatase superfamily [Zychaea mexicana]